jgi:hypothetical protein
MKNRYVSVRCPSCKSTIQVKARSVRSEVFFCPVCEYGEIENPVAPLFAHLIEGKLPAARRVPVRIRP